MAPPRWLILIGFWLPFVVTTYAAFAPEGVPMPFRVSDIVLHAGAFTYLTAALWFAHHTTDNGWKPAAWMIGLRHRDRIDPVARADAHGRIQRSARRRDRNCVGPRALSMGRDPRLRPGVRTRCIEASILTRPKRR